VHTKIISWASDKPEVLYSIRLVDGKLQFEGNVTRLQKMAIESDYSHFRQRYPEGSDEAFLKTWLEMAHVGSSFVRPQFVPEG
jgi:hypothetical protein